MTTTLTRNRRPLIESSNLLPDLDRMMAGFFRPIGDFEFPGVTRNGWMPAVDVRETDEGFVIEAELPGLKKGDVTVTFEDGVLTLSGERRFEQESEEKTYRRIERHYGSFSRSFHLGRQIDTEKIAATFEEGILTVSIPKTEAVKPRAIQIS